ncbi:MAG: DUF3299 domain-containing protein [Gammaproteobacteria bacterium]|nr:DUF3299 domain-containing protein [Gammaproteobacteria bacterium]
MYKIRTLCMQLAGAAIVLAGLFLAIKTLWWSADLTVPDNTDEQVYELNWEDLIPDNFRPAENPLLSLSREERDKLFNGSEESIVELTAIEEKLNYSPVVTSLNGKRVKMPGYIVPLEYDEQRELSEFLLVPYYGACIHTPPPPANQVVFAKSKTRHVIDNTYDPVWVIGTMHTQTFRSGVAEAGYTIELESMLAYSPP